MSRKRPRKAPCRDACSISGETVKVTSKEDSSSLPSVSTKANLPVLDGTLDAALPALHQLAANVARLEVSVDELNAMSRIQGGMVVEKTKDAKTSQNKAFKAYVRDHIQLLLGITTELPPSDWPLPDEASKLSYGDSGFQTTGAIIPQLRIDWNLPQSTPWNKRAAVIFECHFLSEYRLGSFPLLETAPQPGRAADAFMKRVKYLKRVYVKNKLQKETEQRRARVRSRRQQLLMSRLSASARHKLPATAVEAIRLLGIDGMSSEASEGDVGEVGRKYLTKTVPWRDPDVTDWLHRLDSLPDRDPSTLCGRVYRKRTRELSELPSTRSAPCGLPISFYSAEWLSGESERAVAALDISPVPYILPDLPRNATTQTLGRGDGADAS